MAQTVLDDSARRDLSRRGRRGRPGELGSLDRDACHLAHELVPDDDDEAQDHRVAIAPPRGRVDEDRRSDDVADDPVDDLDRMLGCAELEDPRLWAVGSGQAQPIAVQPHDEDLGLDRAIDIPTGGGSGHRIIVATVRPIMPGMGSVAAYTHLVTNRPIAQARLRNSRLVGPAFTTPEDAVAWFGAVQAQDIPGALWAIAQRLERDGPARTIHDLGEAMDDGRIVRTHGPRPTWHFMAPRDLRWILSVVGPRVQAQNASMERREGIRPEDRRRAIEILRSALRGGVAMTRPELGAALAAGGIERPEGLRLGLLGMSAELDAVIANGPRRGRQTTFMLVDDRVLPTPPRTPADALRELTIRYFQSHGPALAHDMAWWSGLTVTSVREGIGFAGSVLEGRRIDGKEYWAAAGTFDPEPGLIPEPQVLLLPNYDEAIASYRDYGPALDEAAPTPSWINDSVGAHPLVRDGLVIGRWRRALARDRVTVTATSFVRLTREELDALERAAEGFGRFLGVAVDLRVADA